MTKAAKYVNRTTTLCWLLSLRPNRQCRWSNNCNRMWQNHDIPTLSLRMKRPTQVKVRPNRFRGVNTKKVTVLMTQFSVNLNDALKGHKLQGMSKVKRPSHHTRRVFKQHTAKDVWNLGKYTFFSRVRSTKQICRSLHFQKYRHERIFQAKRRVYAIL